MEEFRKPAQTLIDKTKKNIMQSYFKYKGYYDRKPIAAPLEKGNYCFVLQTLGDHQGFKISFREFRWIGSYVIKKILPNENYIVRRPISNKTQILQRIRTRKYNPNTTLQDIRHKGKLQAKWMMKLLYNKTTYILFHGRQILKISLQIPTQKHF